MNRKGQMDNGNSKKIYQITIEINKLLEGQDTTIERQQMIEQISSLIEKKGRIFTIHSTPLYRIRKKQLVEKLSN